MSGLIVEGLVGGYPSADHIVKGVSLSVAPGEFVVIIGPNGAGKSTALKLIAGLLVPKAGHVGIGDRALQGATPQQIIAAGLTLVPQERNVFGGLTVQENLDMGGFLDRSGLAARRRAMMARFPLLGERKSAFARTLSGGQRQILALAIALMVEPKILLLDEPSAGLSPKAAAELFATVRAIAESGVGILMIEQNALQALNCADRGYVLVDGTNRAEGTGKILADDPDIRRLFLGGDRRPTARHQSNGAPHP
ncbi:MAG TPA: ABC transporter ATP-binding protein [Stellaceae bacterium]|nr:ABC transporter ATP-binding protein [Stellaceae bacterium]